MRYVKVVIDNNSIHTDTFYTYRCQDDSVQVGDKVYVPFGKGNRRKAAYVFQITDQLDEEVPHLKDLAEKDPKISLDGNLIELAVWMKDTYLCKYIDAIKCMIPSGDEAKRGVRKDPTEGMECAFAEVESLTEEQKHVLEHIYPTIDEKNYETFLLHGVTGSGKTEVYIQVIRRVLSQGRNAIILVPEISLTPQTMERFISRFGPENCSVMHSKLTLGQRYDQWMKVKHGEAKILIGARSGIFAPFDNVGAIIIDEEHESSYKSDMTPKYDTIDVAVKRGQQCGAVVILGSATPSVVSSYRATQGSYRKLEMRKRYNQVKLPAVEICDMREELKSGNKSIFSISMYEKIKQNLESGKQVILFLNRRGYSSFISCRSCGFVLKCQDCQIAMTYHKDSDAAECHYCGQRVNVPKNCPSCGSKYMKHFGIGTEKVAEMAKIAFPEYQIDRLDLDTAKKRGSLDKILNSFKRGKTNILIGTQLVAKGLDIANVGMVGVIAADVTLNIPDFRSAERTFQLITQASGRAGRGHTQGQVVIQTYNPDHYAIQAAADNDYEGFFQQELLIRQMTGYPPFSVLIQLLFNGKDEVELKSQAEDVFRIISEKMAPDSKTEIFPPQPAYRWKMGEHYRYYLLIKCVEERKTEYLQVLRELRLQDRKEKKQTFNFVIDINPYSLG